MTAPRQAAGEQVRTLAVAAMGTVLVLVAYTTPIATLASTASGLGAGPAGQAWILSSMSCGLAVGLLPAGAIGDDHGRRRMFAAGPVLLALEHPSVAASPVASAPFGLASIGSGANNTARYLADAIGVTIVAVLAGHPTSAGVISGWNVAVLVNAAISVAGALTVVALGPRASSRRLH